MNPARRPDIPGQLDDPREIAKWTRVYAQNRTLSVGVFLVIFLILCAAIAGLTYGVEWASQKRNAGLVAACLSGLIAALAALVYFSIPAWGGERMTRIARALYAKEGSVTVAGARAPGRRLSGAGLALGFGSCVLASVVLGALGYIPDRYMQPVSATYVVPFLVTLIMMQRPALGWIFLLWPVLYGLHALLILAGAPIVFGGPWSMLNMLIPTVGYGLLTSMLGHAYSRYALHSVKQLARMGPSGDSRWEGKGQP